MMSLVMVDDVISYDKCVKCYDHCKTDMVIPSYDNWEKHTLVITDFV